ncbi:Ribonuclease H [Quillaja saponaria]|uniref:Ribonuclease H n=1 Tax=Quillaja saponaria TaxID=32244 RepID=A0AAD7VKX0_QUISA|nr:Ribonuclease H [Quillaja saponaria]
MGHQVKGCPLSFGQEAMVEWVFPGGDWVKLNTDEASKGGALAGAGGVLRHFYGFWLSGFSHNLGVCSTIVAELWGVFGRLWLKSIQWQQCS